MSIPALVLVVVGLALLVVGGSRARQAWPRYTELRDREANISRYEAWRGGLRDERPSAASFMMRELLRRAQIGTGLAIVGLGCFVAAFLVR